MKTVISAKEAKEAGLKKYFTGVECKNGHIAERYTGNRECVECDRARKLARKAAKLMNVPAAPAVVPVIQAPPVAMKTVRVVVFKTPKINSKGFYYRGRPEIIKDFRKEVRV